MVVFTLDDLEVFFPYDFVYPEQYEYMMSIKKSLDAQGHCVLEMPTGTGKTVSLFSLITSYQYAHPTMGKLVYCTRTVPEMEKALEELKIVVEYRQTILEKRMGCSSGIRPGGALAIGLSARRNMCVNPLVSQEPDRDIVDQKCRMLTSKYKAKITGNQGTLEWDPASAEPVSANPLPGSSVAAAGCQFYENLQHSDGSRIVADDVYTIEDLKVAGVTSDRPFCPYFASRRLVHTADVVVLNYQYVLDPRVAAASLLMGKGLAGGEGKDEDLSSTQPAVVVFDEGHNIDNVCVEALSITLTRDCLDKATRGLRRIQSLVDREKEATDRLISDEYQRLVEGLRADGRVSEEVAASLTRQGAVSMDDAEAEQNLTSPLLEEDAVRLSAESMPGNIRKVSHFLNFLHRVLTYMKSKIRVMHVESEGPLSFLMKLEDEAQVDAKALRHVHERFKSLLSTLKLSPFGDFQKLAQVCDFITLLATYCEGFIVILDPYPEAEGLWDPVLQLHCLDASLAMKPVFKRFKSVVLTSATLSPLYLYPKLLKFPQNVPTESKALDMSLDRECVLPLIVTKSAEQSDLVSAYNYRNDAAIVKNYGALVLEMAKAVPDGIVVFFTSYAYMDQVVSSWYSSGVLMELSKHKLVFMESPTDVVATTLALNNYRRACDSGRGAIFLSVARGRVSEGIDFDRHYGRAVLLIGVPFQNALVRGLKARLDFLEVNDIMQASEFITFDAMRQASQCLGRVIRSKADYGVMVLADSRYSKKDKVEKLPRWVQTRLRDHTVGVSTKEVIDECHVFLRQMAQPFAFGSSKTRLDKAELDKRAGVDPANHDTQKMLTEFPENHDVNMTHGGDVPNPDGEKITVGFSAAMVEETVDDLAKRIKPEPGYSSIVNPNF